jgi:hypothetical protein
MSTTHELLFTTVATALVCACDPEALDAAPLGDVELRCSPLAPLCGTGSGNTPFTGLVIGLSLLDTTYAEHEGTKVEKLTLAGGIGVVDAFWAKQGELFASKVDIEGVNVEYSGYDLTGAIFSLSVNDIPVEFVIVDVLEPAPGHDYWHYTFTYQSNDMANPEPACVASDANDFGAVVQRDLEVDPKTGDITFRANTVFVACDRGALGEISYEPLGYGFRPWVTGLSVFEAATDMLRANYCDDGKSWTDYGNQIAQQNKYGISNDALPGGLDGVWTVTGAICLGENLRGGRTYDDIQCAVKPPKCTDAEGLAMYQLQGRFITHAL